MSNQRQHERSNVRTVVTVLLDGDEHGTPLQVFKAWTEDISASGMQLACNEELPAGALYVRILLPGLEDKVVECSVMRRGRREPTGLLKNTGPRFIYGVRFTRVRSYDEFQQQVGSRLEALLAAGPESRAS